jgi:hypothetical protein
VLHTHSYCSDDDWEECSSGADSFADHSSTDVPENPSGTHRLPGASDTCTTSNIHALVTAPANVSTGPRPATCNTTNIHALVTAPATVDTYTDKHALVTVFPRPQQTPCKYLIKAFQYIDLIEHDLFSECYTATAPTSIPIVPPPRPSSTHHYSRADELLMSARMISLHRHNIQLRTLTVLDQLSLPLHLHNSTYHPSLIPQAVSAIRPRRTSLRKQPTPSSFRTTTHTPHVQIPPPLASHERSTITVNALLSRYPLPRNPPPRSMTRRRAFRSQRARTPSVPSYILATPPLRVYSTPQLTRPSLVPSRTVTKPFSLVRRVYLPTRRTLCAHTCHLLRAVSRACEGLLPPRTRTRARTRPRSVPRSASVPSTSSSPSSLPVSRGPPASPFPLFLLPPCGVVPFPCCFLRYEYRMKYPP